MCLGWGTIKNKSLKYIKAHEIGKIEYNRVWVISIFILVWMQLNFNKSIKEINSVIVKKVT